MLDVLENKREEKVEVGNYSQIKKIKIKNYGVLSNVEFEMDRPIMALKGTNSSGKSTTIRAIGSALANYRGHKQSKDIKIGTKGWAVLIELEDGTKVLRQKTSRTNSYKLEKADGTKLESDRIATEVPDYIQEVFGITKSAETGSLIQLRTCTEPLMLVDTKGSDNYRLLSEAINKDGVKEAIALAKVDYNKVTGSIAKETTKKEVYRGQLRGLSIIDTNYLEVLRGRVDSLKELGGVYGECEEAREELRGIQGLDKEELWECDILDVVVHDLYVTIAEESEELKGTRVEYPYGVEKVGVEIYDVIVDLSEYIGEYRGIREIGVGDAKEVDEGKYRVWEECREYKDELVGVKEVRVEGLGRVEADVFDISGEVKELKEELEKIKRVVVPEWLGDVAEDILEIFEGCRGMIGDKEKEKTRGEKLAKEIKRVEEILDSYHRESGTRLVKCDSCGKDIFIEA